MGRSHSRLAAGLVRTLIAVMLAAFWLPSAHAQSSVDYDPRSEAWNGLSSLFSSARHEGRAFTTVAELDLEQVGANDSVFIVFPSERLPSRGLTSLLKRGVRVVLADDFGAGDRFLSTFEITRHTPSGSSAVVEGHPQVMLARQTELHLLSEGVDPLVTNHPTVLSHRALRPVFKLNPESGFGVVLAGAVGEGRLVAIGDPSILINNMLEFEGNARFAKNLIHYLIDNRQGRVYFVGPNTRVIGDDRDTDGGAGLRALDDGLKELASIELPSWLLKVAGLGLLALAMMIALVSVPRRSPYDAERIASMRQPEGGFLGRREFFGSGRQNLLHAALVHRHTLEARLLDALSLPQGTALRDVIAAMEKSKRVPRGDMDATREMLVALTELHRKQDHPPSPPRVSQRALQGWVSLGDRVLSALRQSDG